MSSRYLPSQLGMLSHNESRCSSFIRMPVYAAPVSKRAGGPAQEQGALRRTPRVSWQRTLGTRGSRITRKKIFFQTAGSKVLTELTKTPYPGEAVLQKALADAPEVIAGFSTTEDEPRLLLIKREMAVPAADNSGTLRIDHLYVDATGVPGPG